MSVESHESHVGLPERGVMFWLPPGGFSNGVPAAAWAEIADLTEAQLAPVLFGLAEARIGGYVAIPAGAKSSHRPPRYRLWVDTRQYSRAADLLMGLFREFKHGEFQHGQI